MLDLAQIRASKRPLTNVPDEVIERLWANLTVTTEQIGGAFGVSRQAVRFRARRMGLKARKAEDMTRLADTAEFRRLWVEGASLEFLRQHFGYATIRGVCHTRKQLGLPCRERSRDGTGNRGGWLAHGSDEEIAERLVGEAMAAIAAQENAARRNVDRGLK